jgi:hypothetical protein
MSISITEMIDLIQECRERHNDSERKLSYKTITDVCTHIRMPFLIDPLTKSGRPKKGAYNRRQALAHLRSFGTASGEFYLAEVLQPSVINIITNKSIRARLIHKLIEEGLDKNAAIAQVVREWDVAPTSPPLDRRNVKREYGQWLDKQNSTDP